MRAKRKLILPDSSIAREFAAEGKGKGRKSDPYVLDVSSDSDQPSSPVASGVQASEEAGDYTLQLELEALSATDGSIPSSPDVPLSTTSSPLKPRRGRSRSLSTSPDIPLATSLAEEEELAVEPTPALATTMTTAIRSNPALWDRVLKYEPISFDEFVSVATQSGLSMAAGKSKEELRTWLDRQCICHYSNDLTGPRSRH
ncbi:Structure-specific endonuclease subunit Slx4 [Kalmanozyma brasiliensis GHG001]|uniref:Structure-specific endonuclease subunit Slx4 n=1 Tax=Kalmanozyma brasiliensis (strain GHG001) TaxID=1365824 RepID=UPI001CE8CDEB|nr:Structure-specific endonuclease subunit Slx4 [Kalmanozyma brasiliensis GHG001]EST08333.2 Structure-specific endonuclease subunit Slx4 [Kalmanozyma brasiliensis GHG001]